jgi:hypothetical protein
MVAFSTIGDTPPSGGMLLLLGVLGVASHLVLLPVVLASGTLAWTRACGYAWIAIDVMLNVATVNGMALAAVTPLRLGSHVLTAVWIGDAALAAGGLATPVGLVLAALLAGHALTAPWIPPWVLFIPFALVPVWLVLLGRAMARSDAMPAPVSART